MSIKDTATPGFEADNDTGDFCLITPEPTVPSVSGEDAAHHLIVDGLSRDPHAFSPGVNPACRSTMPPVMPEAVDEISQKPAIQSSNKVQSKPNPTDESMILFLLEDNRKIKQQLATLDVNRDKQPGDREPKLEGERLRYPFTHVARPEVPQSLPDARPAEKTPPEQFGEPSFIPPAPQTPSEHPELSTPEKPISNARHYNEATQLWNAIHTICDLLEATRKAATEKSKPASSPDCGGPVPPQADFQDPFAAIDVSRLPPPMPPHDVLDDFDFDAFLAEDKVEPEEAEFSNSKFSALCAVQGLERKLGVGGKGASKPKKGKKKVGQKVVGEKKKKEVKTLRRKATDALGALVEKLSLESFSDLCNFGILLVFVVIAFQLSTIAGLMMQDHKSTRSWW